jgi:hypothetical protein
LDYAAKRNCREQQRSMITSDRRSEIRTETGMPLSHQDVSSCLPRAHQALIDQQGSCGHKCENERGNPEH